MSEDRLDEKHEPADMAGFDFGETPSAAAKNEAQAAYRVLARKYRPSSFADLIGQEAMVKTLSNAFELDRIHQAYILTGVRGVGKTTTARILARAFNYELPAQDGRPAVTRPTIHMPEIGVHCQAIMESRHVDVIEMDAASHTGIDDIREIIESARYRPVMARTKVYIIDEVHMLSKQAFNGLLKTLEEPPDHVKFLFATTEIEKVPITVRSRCQRFDLRRVDAQVLAAHLAMICGKENVSVEPEALTLIARAAEGSVRDALSLLDQAIAASTDKSARADDLRVMLGLADRTRIIDLFEDVMAGRIGEALRALKDLHNSGADPGQILVELAEFVHFVTRLKLVPDAAQDVSITQEEHQRGAEFAKSLGMAVLTRAWQLLLKGVQEVKDSPRPLASADMILVRLAYAAELPTPDEALRKIASSGSTDAGPSSSPPGSSRARTGAMGGGGSVARAAEPLPQSAPRAASDQAPLLHLAKFEDLVALAASRRDIQLKLALERDVRLIRFEEGSIEFSLGPGASAQLAQHLMRRLQEWTGQRWMVAISKAEGAPSLKEQAAAIAKDARTGVEADPLVQSVLAAFPGAQVVDVRSTATPPAAAEIVETNDEIAYADQIYTEDDL
jgi:DNA polymerase III subunit gamma/tau